MSRASLATGSGGGGLSCGSETDSWPLSVFSKSVKWGTCIKVKYSCTKKFKVVVMLARRKALERQQCFSPLVLLSVLPVVPLPPNTAILPSLDKKSWHSSCCFFHSIVGSAGISPCSTLLQHHLSAISAALQVNCISLKFCQFRVWIMLSVSVSPRVKLVQLCSWSPKSDEVFYPGSLVTGYSVTVWSWHTGRLFIMKLRHPHPGQLMASPRKNVIIHIWLSSNSLQFTSTSL